MSSRMRRSLGVWRWFIPGLGVKRWLLMAAIGGAFFVNGVSRYLTDEGYTLRINEMVDGVVSEFFPPGYLSWIFMALGVDFIFQILLGMARRTP